MLPLIPALKASNLHLGSSIQSTSVTWDVIPVNFGVHFVASHGYLSHLKNSSGTPLNKKQNIWNYISRPSPHPDYCSENKFLQNKFKNLIIYPWLYLFYSYLPKIVIFTVMKIIWRDCKGILQIVQPTRSPANILIPCTLPEKYWSFTPTATHLVKIQIETIEEDTVHCAATMVATTFLQECVPIPPP